jgi:hypothetical protein
LQISQDFWIIQNYLCKGNPVEKVHGLWTTLVVRSTMDQPPETTAHSPELGIRPLRGTGICRWWSGRERGAHGEFISKLIGAQEAMLQCLVGGDGSVSELVRETWWPGWCSPFYGAVEGRGGNGPRGRQGGSINASNFGSGRGNGEAGD